MHKVVNEEPSVNSKPAHTLLEKTSEDNERKTGCERDGSSLIVEFIRKNTDKVCASGSKVVGLSLGIARILQDVTSNIIHGILTNNICV